MEHRSPTPPRDSTLTSLRGLFAPKADPYAGADVALACRTFVIMWSFSLVVVAVLELFFPPTRAFGDVGWLVNAAEFAIACGILWVLVDKRWAVGYDALYVIGFLAVALIGGIQYGAGGYPAPYHELYMFLLVGASLMHPPRRVLPFFALLAAAMLAPLVYAPGRGEIGEVTTELLLWVVLSLVLMLLMQTIRAQRTQLRQEGDEARRLARVDALTGLGNRRAFDESLDAELARGRRNGASLCLIVADLNGLKAINDEFGHLLGDDCLRQAAVALRAGVRKPDTCFRWGGDEFMMLITGSDAPDGEVLATRLEMFVADSCTRPDGEPLTLMCGYAVLEPNTSAAEAVACSDAALLLLKARARAVPAVVPMVLQAPV
jgi:diguanylate cyclase (GGDEF)-like protein